MTVIVVFDATIFPSVLILQKYEISDHFWEKKNIKFIYNKFYIGIDCVLTLLKTDFFVMFVCVSFFFNFFITDS